MRDVDSRTAELHCLREGNQALTERLKQHSEENEALKDKVKILEVELREKEALTDKVKFLELKLEDLELQLKLSEAAEKKALSLLSSLRNSEKEKTDQCKREIVYNEPRHLSDLKSFVPVDCSGAAKPADKEIFHKQVEFFDNVQEKGAAIDSTEGNDSGKRLNLDRIVDLACGPDAMSNGFCSQVDQIFKAKEAISPALNGSRKLRILSGALSYVSNDDPSQDIAVCSSHPHTSELHFPNQDVASKEALHMSPGPRDPLQTQSLRKDFDNISCPTGLAAFQDGEVAVNGELLSKTSDCMRDASANMPVPEVQPPVVDTGLHTEKETGIDLPHVSSDKATLKMHLQSASVSARSDIKSMKAKAGFRRMVIQSDTESESGNMEGILSSRDMGSPRLCDTTKNASHPMSSNADGDKSDNSSIVRSSNKSASNKAGQLPLQRSKRRTVYVSDQSDEVRCIGESDMSNHQSAQPLKTASSEFGGIGVDGSTDEEDHVGLRRSKRLWKMQGSKYRSRTESASMEKVSSSTDDRSGSLGRSELSKSEASSSIPIVSTRVRKKRISRTRKRLFVEDESRPLYAHSTGSDKDDSEIESDADSLGDFITDSEGTEVSRSSYEDHASTSGSHSSREVYHDPKHTRDIKMRNYVWELEGEMLAVLATDPRLCLRAVCALNIRQTEDEQIDKASKYRNKRGFDKPHAERGSRIAEFLTDGNVAGPVKKSLEDLGKFDAGGVEFCKMLALKHSKQLFDMYTSAEDPHFPFS